VSDLTERKTFDSIEIDFVKALIKTIVWAPGSIYRPPVQDQYSLLQSRGLPCPLLGKWIELENIILSEVTQTQKDKHAEDIDQSPNETPERHRTSFTNEVQ
ncbi:hypothetical protein STEG23_003612, partial [Scotinomys teguina]